MSLVDVCLLNLSRAFAADEKIKSIIHTRTYHFGNDSFRFPSDTSTFHRCNPWISPSLWKCKLTGFHSIIKTHSLTSTRLPCVSSMVLLNSLDEAIRLTVHYADHLSRRRASDKISHRFTTSSFHLFFFFFSFLFPSSRLSSLPLTYSAVLTAFRA